MSLPHGGHLTHGAKVSFSGKWFDAVHYGVDKETEDIDYDEVERLAKEHRPKVILAGGLGHPADHRLRALPGDRRRGRRGLLGRRRPLHRPRRRQGHPEPGAPMPTSSRSRPTRCCAAPRSGAIVCTGGARRGDRQGGLPDDAGRAADAHRSPRRRSTSRSAPPRSTPSTPDRSSPTPRRSPPSLGEHGIRPRPAAPTPTSRCTTSRRSASPEPTPRPAATPRASR